MKILVVGSGGREHALCRALVRSPLCTELLCAPGNAGIALDAELRNVAADDVDGLTKLAVAEKVDFVVVGPEVALVAGIVDKLAAHGIKAFGPNKAAAQLEGSKAFMKDLVARHNVPTAAYGKFTDAAAAKDFIRKHGAPIVVKASGLAAGKGVVVATSLDEALAAVDQIMGAHVFGNAGDEVVVEEFLPGEEASFFALVDGATAIPMGFAQDHKRVGDGDSGPNTGGMGAYSPAPIVTPDLEAKVMETMIMPTVRGMASEGIPFKGILFAGLMIDRGRPKLLEYNVRFGDPECQVLMARLKSDLVELLVASADGKLAGKTAEWSKDSAMVVVMAAKGYPGDVVKGTIIEGTEDADQMQGVDVLHAATARDEKKRFVANGGRVLGVTAVGATLKEAHDRAYRAVERIKWPEGFCRRDIGWRELKR